MVAALEIWRRFKIRSVFVSGNIDDAMKQRAAPAQHLGFVSKPFLAQQQHYGARRLSDPVWVRPRASRVQDA